MNSYDEFRDALIMAIIFSPLALWFLRTGIKLMQNPKWLKTDSRLHYMTRNMLIRQRHVLDSYRPGTRLSDRSIRHAGIMYGILGIFWLALAIYGWVGVIQLY